MINILTAGILAMSLSAPQVDWTEITTDFSHWSYYSQKDMREYKKIENCFVWVPESSLEYTILQKKDKK
jgi:hypothetical protein|tara:strand:+ start:100 stop:306 length:207 start_codon:yes stop_codon:yes gene_type:complete